MSSSLNIFRAAVLNEGNPDNVVAKYKACLRRDLTDRVNDCFSRLGSAEKAQKLEEGVEFVYVLQMMDVMKKNEPDQPENTGDNVRAARLIKLIVG